MRNLAERQKEERTLLYQVFTEDAKTDNERLIGYLDAQFVEKSLDVMRMSTLMGIGSRKVGRTAFRETLEHMMEQEIQQRYSLGLIELTKIKLSEVKSVMYNFHFKIIKVKAEKIKNGKKAIRYKNAITIGASDLESARYQLKDKLRKLGDIMIEELSVRKNIDMIITYSGDVYAAYAVEIDAEN